MPPQNLGRRFVAGLFLLPLALSLAVASRAETLSGAGSSAAAPVYRAWAAAYGGRQDFQFAYQPVGSRPPGSSRRGRARSASALRTVGNGKLRLSGEVLAAIFLGQVTRWNVPEIQKLNPGLALPDLDIKPVVRSDGSGTTYYFTDYLSKISPEWRKKFGTDTAIAWPTDFVAAKGSDGVSKAVRDTAGAIGGSVAISCRRESANGPAACPTREVDPSRCD